MKKLLVSLGILLNTLNAFGMNQNPFQPTLSLRKENAAEEKERIRLLIARRLEAVRIHKNLALLASVSSEKVDVPTADDIMKKTDTERMLLWNTTITVLEQIDTLASTALHKINAGKSNTDT